MISKILLAFLTIGLACCSQNRTNPDDSPDLFPKLPGNTKRVFLPLFTYQDEPIGQNFPVEVKDSKRGYSLILRGSGKVLRSRIPYRKTFGGRFPQIQLHLIAGRYLVYPETIPGSEIPDTLFHEMKGRTRIIDITSGQEVYRSAAYRYDHDVPLKYDWKP